MRKSGLIGLFILLITTTTFGQQAFTVRGTVIDSAGKALQGATVTLYSGKDSAIILTNQAGKFLFQQISKDSFTLRASYTGLQTFQTTYAKTGRGEAFQIPDIQLLPSSGDMENIVITSVRPVLIKEDTIQFDAAAYKVREGAPVEDVIKKLPGVTVDKDGNIEAQGKKVARVRVNGKDFFGGDVQTATQNLPAEIIQNIQLIDDYGDGANLTGIKTGEPEKIININTLPNKNKGNFGNATVAGGNEGRYAANAFVNNFNNERQISVLASINNTNANLFNFNGGGRGGGARGANFGSDSRGGPGGNGITLSKAFGGNYRDKWGEKISVYGSYSFTTRQTNTVSSSYAQDLNTLRTTLRDSKGINNSTNQRVTFNLEYSPDSVNYIKVSPYFSYSQSSNQNNSRSEVSRAKYFTLNNSQTSNESHSPNAGGSFFYNHRFGKRGRNFSTNISYDFSDNNSDRFTDGTYHNIDSTYSPIHIKDTLQIQAQAIASRNARTNAHLSYMEPLNQSGTTVFELYYDWNNSVTESLRDVTDFADAADKDGRYNDRQSNHYNYTFTTNKAGVSIKGRKEKYNYSVGVESQPSKLLGGTAGKGYTTNYTNVNWIPSLRFVYNFARNNSLTATIDGSAREPGFMQLQPVADSSNLNNIVVGNPNLANEFTTTYRLRYNKFDSKAGSSLFINFSHDRTDNKIVSSRINNKVGTGRTTTYLNTDGFNGYDASASFTQPFSNRKYVAGASFAASYDNNISFTDGRKNKGSNWNLRPGVSFRLDLQDKVDVTLRASYTAYETTTRDTTSVRTTKAQTLNYGINGKNYFGNFTLGYDFSKIINYGFSSSVNSNPAILSVFAEYRLLKGRMLTLRLQGFDLFNKNTGVTRTMNENTVTDSRINRLGRYFLLSANVRMAKFAGGHGGGFRQHGGLRRNNF